MSNEERLEQLIKQECEKVKGLPVALSGGIDSSLLAALVKPSFVISVQLPGDEKYNEIKYAKIVSTHLNLPHHIVTVNDNQFDETMRLAVKAIGRPIPHFNIYPLYKMYEYLAGMGVKDLVLGDGPDETMCGYARDLIIHYLYKVYDFEAFEHYKELIDRILPSKTEAVRRLTGILTTDISFADMQMRKDMDDMSNALAKHFGIANHRPYQDNPEIDNFMLGLPINQKIYEVEYGKALLRKIAEKYLPVEIARRKKKVGGPVYPVNVLRGWMDKGEFDKTEYINYQIGLLNEPSS